MFSWHAGSPGTFSTQRDSYYGEFCEHGPGPGDRAVRGITMEDKERVRLANEPYSFRMISFFCSAQFSYRLITAICFCIIFSVLLLGAIINLSS